MSSSLATKLKTRQYRTLGVYLPEPVFSHGQLYVAMSRGKYKHNIKMLVLNSTNAEGKTYTKNIVYRQVLRDQAHHGL